MALHGARNGNWTLAVAIGGWLAAWLAAKPGGDAVFSWVNAVGCILGSLAGGFWCWPDRQALGKSSHSGRRPVGEVACWICFALGAFSFTAGQVVYYGYVLIAGKLPFPSAADVGFVAVYPFMAAGVLLLPAAAGRKRRVGGRAMLDAAIAVAAVATFSWYHVVGPIVVAGHLDPVAKSLAAAYPVLDLILLLCLAIAGGRTWGRDTVGGLLPLHLGFATVVAADTVFAYQNFRGVWVDDTWADALWPIGYVLVGLGASKLRRRRGAAGRAAPSTSAAGDVALAHGWAWSGGVSFGLLVPAVALVAYAVCNPSDANLDRGVLMAAAVLATLVTARLVLSVRDNAALAARLAETCGRLDAARRSSADAVATLRRSEERYRLVNRATSDIVWDLDLVDGRLFWNDSITTAFGHPTDEIEHSLGFWHRNIHPDDRAGVTAGFEAAVKGSAEIWSAEYRFRRGDGGPYAVVLDRGYITRDASGRATRMIGAMQDVTERRAAESELRFRDGLVLALAEATQHLLTADGLGVAIRSALASVGRSTGVCRAYLLQNHADADGSLFATQRYEWCREGINPQADNPVTQRLPLDGPLAGWRDNLAAGRAVGGTTADMPDAVRRLYQGHDIRSLVVVPVTIDGAWWGEIGLDDCRTARVWGEAEVSILMALAGSIGGAIARHRSESRLHHDSLHDALTGLPNRALFHDRVERSIRRAAADPTYHFAVLFLDLDRFKVINDSLGHAAGDRLLVTIGERLRRCVRGGDKQPVVAKPELSADLDEVVDQDVDRPEDETELDAAAAALPGPTPIDGKPAERPKRRGTTTIARLGGDEFTVLLDDLRSPADAVRVGERILAAIAAPAVFAGHEIGTTASVGVAIGGGATGGLAVDRTAKDLLRDADTAMYRAKGEGKNRCVVFDQSMHESAVARLRLETELRRAEERRELVLYYQPIVSLSTREIAGFEALIRWRRADGELVNPADFIPVAEDTGLIVPIGAWVLGEACRQLAAWRAAYRRPVSVSVNVSRRQLADPGLVGTVGRALAATGVDPRAVKLEITESVVMGRGDEARLALEALKRTGVRLSMDDFGTGYSSLSCLHEFPLDELKIDRSFVRDVVARRDAAAVIHAIVSLAHNLGISVVAEGLEKAEQVAFLQAIDCDLGQGFLFAKPMTAEEAGRLLAAADGVTAKAA